MPGKPGEANTVAIASAVNADGGEFSYLLAAEAGKEDPATTCAALDDATIFNILAYHVTDVRRFSNSVFNANNVKFIALLNDYYIMSNPNLTFDSIGAQGVGIALDADDNPMANINASNGVIHVIDAALLPFTL